MKSCWAEMTAQEAGRALQTDVERGLSSAEAASRLKKHGPNKLPEKSGPSPLRMLAGQFTDFMVLVLIGAAIVSWILGEHSDALAILAIVILNAVLGFVQEFRAERSLAALRDLTAPQVRVVRNGHAMIVPASEVVPGDMMLIESGDRVSADGRVVWSGELETNEAALTGESLPVTKSSKVLPKGSRALGDQHNMVFSGTMVTRGRARAVVIATGTGTELGKIAGMIQEAESGDTPLQQRLTQLGKWLVYACGAVCLAVGAIGVIRGEPVRVMFLSAVSLAVAAIPEGLPAIVTIALAIGVQRMIQRRVIIRKLPAVETLGCATVICSDKTGTLTENEMTVVRLATALNDYRVTGTGYRPDGEIRDTRLDTAVRLEEHFDLEWLLRSAWLCNNAEIIRESGRDGQAAWRIVGDPTEGALRVAAQKGGLERSEARNNWRLEAEYPFESERKRMSVIHRDEKGRAFIFTKGAPEAVLSICDRISEAGEVRSLDEARRAAWLGRAESMASDALRVLAVAFRELPPGASIAGMRVDQVEQGLTFLGLAGMYDPPRPEVSRAIATCRRAGILPVMITGDHPRTAVAVAHEIGLATGDGGIITGVDLDVLNQKDLERKVEKTSVFARVSPHHKLRIVRALKRRGQVVAMTGDGVNDAPAVKEADIGVAMGVSGTEVTKEAAAMVVTDDNFASIVAAIEEGRAIYDNIRKFIRYLLGCNTGEVLTMFVAAISGMPLPLLPIQILWINLVTDGLPALALGVEAPESDLMQRPPRPPSEGIFARGLARSVLGKGVLIGFCTVAIFLIGLSTGTMERARTLAFCTLVLSQLVFAFQCRSEHHGLIETGLFGNMYLVGATALSLLMQLSVLYIEPLRRVFSTVALSIHDWGLVVLFSSWSMVIAETLRFFRSIGHTRP